MQKNYSENYKALKKEIKDDRNRWKDIPYYWTGKINIVKMTVLFIAIYRFNAIPTKLPVLFFTELEQQQQKILIFMETQETLNRQAILRKRNRTGGIKLPVFRLYCKFILIKTVWYHHKN